MRTLYALRVCSKIYSKYLPTYIIIQTDFDTIVIADINNYPWHSGKRTGYNIMCTSKTFFIFYFHLSINKVLWVPAIIISDPILFIALIFR